MFIKTITIEGVDEDVTITHTDDGATVSVSRFTRSKGRHARVLCEIGKYEDRESRYAKAYEVAKVVCGTDKKGRPNATNSMIHEILTEMERVAGC